MSVTVTIPMEDYDELKGGGGVYPDPNTVKGGGSDYPDPTPYAMVMAGTGIVLLLAALLADCLQALTLALGLVNLLVAIYLLGWKIHLKRRNAEVERIREYCHHALKRAGVAGAANPTVD